jgi:hypothetical protein
MKKARDLEVHEDLHLQEQFWTVERVGWTLMAAALVAGLLGAFGEGLLSRHTKSDDKSLAVEYVRFGHYKSPLQLQIQVLASNARQGRLSIGLDYTFLGRILITRITPQPVTEELDAGGLNFAFPVHNEEGSIFITISYEPQYVGTLTGRVSLGDGSEVSIRQFIYP